MKKTETNKPFQVLKENVGIAINNKSNRLTTPYIYRVVGVSSASCFTSAEGAVYKETNETKTIGDNTYYKAEILAPIQGKEPVVYCDHSDFARGNGLYTVETVEDVETFVLHSIIRDRLSLSGNLRVKEYDGTIYTLHTDTEYYTSIEMEINDYVYDENYEIVGYISAEESEVEDALNDALLDNTSTWAGKFQWHGSTDDGLDVVVWSDVQEVKENDRIYCLKDNTELDVVEATSSSAPTVSAQIEISYDGEHFYEEGEEITSDTSSAQIKLTNVPFGTFIKVTSEDNGEVVYTD